MPERCFIIRVFTLLLRNSSEKVANNVELIESATAILPADDRHFDGSAPLRWFTVTTGTCCGPTSSAPGARNLCRITHLLIFKAPQERHRAREMDVAPTELDWFWGFDSTNMSRRWRWL